MSSTARVYANSLVRPILMCRDQLSDPATQRLIKANVTRVLGQRPDVRRYHVAEWLGLPNSAISNRLNNPTGHPWSPEELRRLSERLGVPYDTLVPGAAEPQWNCASLSLPDCVEQISEVYANRRVRLTEAQRERVVDYALALLSAEIGAVNESQVALAVEAGILREALPTAEQPQTYDLAVKGLQQRVLKLWLQRKRRLGLTNADLARLFDVSRPAVDHLLHGRYRVPWTVERLQAMAGLLNLSMLELTGGNMVAEVTRKYPLQIKPRVLEVWNRRKRELRLTAQFAARELEISRNRFYVLLYEMDRAPWTGGRLEALAALLHVSLEDLTGLEPGSPLLKAAE